MKEYKNRVSLLAIQVLIAAVVLMISGCQKAPRNLSDEEIAVFNTEFFNTGVHNMNNMLLSSEYSRPEEIDLFQLFYNGVGMGVDQVSEDEIAQLTELCSEAAYLDIAKVTTEEMDAFLQEKLGLGLEETEKRGLDDFFYLEDYDGYYLVHGDTNFMWCTVISGTWESDDKLTLEYEKKDEEGRWTVTLQKTGDSYLFVSNVSQDTYTVTFDRSAMEVINAPAEQTVLVNDNLNDDIIDLGDIEYLKSIGSIEAGYSASGDISYIYGDFWNKKVNSIEDAATVLNASSSLWGNNFHASAAEISVQTVGEGSELVSYYTYTPVVGNVPVVGSQIKLMVDSTGSIDALFNSYDERIASVNTTPEITQEQAEQIAFDSLLGSDRVVEFVNDSMELIKVLYGEDVIDRAQILEYIKESTTVSGSLKIQCMNEDGPMLVYAIHLSNSLAADTDEDPISLAYSETYLITANGNAGQIIREVSTNRS